MLLLGYSWGFAFLLAAVISSTDAAAVFATLRRLPLPRRVAASLEAESGLNDAPVILLVIALAEYLTGESSDPWWLVVVVVVAELIGGAVIGVGIGFAGAALLRRVALPVAGFYPLATLALCVLAYSSASLAHTSGFVAVYLAGVVLGNATLPHRSASIGFAEGMASLAQIGLFVLLGLLVSPGRLPDAVWPALVVGGALLLLARPLSVVASLAWFRFPWAQQAFISWAGLRGAVPIVAATIPLTADVPGATTIFDTVFVLVVVFTVVQGGSLPWVARRLGIATPGGAPRRAGGVRSAGRARRRPHAADRAAGLAAARRLPAGAAAARRRRRRAHRPRGALVRPGRRDPADARRPGADRRGPALPARGRAPAPRGQPGGPAGVLARRDAARPTGAD